MKKVLIITYYWPPAAGPGVQRVLKMTKFMGEFGWEPLILTVKNGTYSSLDNTLEKDIPQNVKVFQTKTLEPFRWLNMLPGKKNQGKTIGLIGYDSKKSLFNKISLYIRANFFIPDARKGWKKYAVPAAIRIIKNHKVDAVITTGPPHSAHLIGLAVKKKLKLPWIADLRDPWVDVFYNHLLPRTKSTVRKDKGLEKKVLTSAGRVTVVSRGLKKTFSHITNNVVEIFNGYDPDDLPPFCKPQKTKRFTLAYIGNFKPNQNTPVLWQACGELMDKHTCLRELLEISLTGNIDGSVIGSIKKQGLEGNLTLRDYVPHAQATQLMSEASLLLFVVPQANNSQLIITGKLFEYIASCTPILSLGPPEGDASQILRETGRGQMYSWDDLQKIKGKILEYYNLWKENNHIPVKVSNFGVEKYTREYQTGRICQEMDNLIKDGPE